MGWSVKIFPERITEPVTKTGNADDYTATVTSLVVICVA